MADTKCFRCECYKAYYTKGRTNFNRLDNGLCTKKNETVDKHGECEKFRLKYWGRVSRKQLALDALIENINLFAEIKQILEEDDEESLEELLLEFTRRKKKGM